MKLGEPEAYDTAALAAMQESKREFEAKLFLEYAGTDRQVIQTKFATSGDSIVAMQEALRAKNSAAASKQLMKLEALIELEYKDHLRHGVEPGVEPTDFTAATTEKAFMVSWSRMERVGTRVAGARALTSPGRTDFCNSARQAMSLRA
jgi:hypothetical protein